MIKKFLEYCKVSQNFIFESGYSVYELIIKCIEKLNEVIEFVNSFQSKIDSKEDSINITNNRKLDENGNFTGTLCNKKSACQIVAEIDDNRDTIGDVAEKIKDKVSLEFIIDGGVAPFDEPPIYEIDGGVING